MTERRPSRKNASPYPRNPPPPHVVSELSADLPVTQPEIQLIMAVLGERIAEILHGEPTD